MTTSPKDREVLFAELQELAIFIKEAGFNNLQLAADDVVKLCRVAIGASSTPSCEEIVSKTNQEITMIAVGGEWAYGFSDGLQKAIAIVREMLGDKP